jgi:hypothetical protein
MEHFEAEHWKIKEGEEVKPIIVITGGVEDFERFCMRTGRDRKTAIQVSQGFQIPLYPDLPIAHYGDYWLNGAYNSPEWRERLNKQKMDEFQAKERGE